MKIKNIFASITLLFLLIGCSSNKEKLSGLWVVHDFKVESGWQADKTRQQSIEFFSDGTFEYSSASNLGPDGEDGPQALWRSTKGRWVFLDDGRLKFDFDDQSKVTGIAFTGEFLQMKLGQMARWIKVVNNENK